MHMASCRMIPLLCLLGLLLAVASPATAAADDSGIYYKLGLMWPGAYCEASENGCCVPKYGCPGEDFFVELFQTFDASSNKPVVRCSNGSPFDAKKLNKIENNINHYWTKIKCPPTDNVNEWKSAWDTYGVCSGLRQLDYFKAGLNLRKQANLLGALADQGILPNYKLYSTAKIKYAVKQKLGVEPGLQCRDGPFGKKQLWQVYLCVDTDAKTFIQCPKLPAMLSCPASAVFHPFYTWMLNSTVAAAGFDSKILLPTQTMLN